MTFRQLQIEHKEWLAHNFPDAPSHEFFFGMVEELGELAHADLKYRQEIRGYDRQHFEEEAKDSVGDLIIFLSGYCSRNGFDLQEVIEDTWRQVKARDWKADPQGGEPAPLHHEAGPATALRQMSGNEDDKLQKSYPELARTKRMVRDDPQA